MDVRRRMSFKKKASSGGGSTAAGSYTVNLNGQWEATTAAPNPDSALYDGVYRSASNYNVNNGVATMYINIKDCSSFKMYIRSYAEGAWDYVMVSQLDKTISGNTIYSNTTLVKAHTYGNQQSGTALSNYTLVEFTGITPGEHTITVVYRKDGSTHSGDDRGYVLIEKFIIPEPIINLDNYLTIESCENGLTATLSTNACEYCVDGDGNWKTLSANTSTSSINSGHTLSFRGDLTPNNSNGIGTFTISKKCNLKGNCMSMLFGDNAANVFRVGVDSAFFKLFYNCVNIVNVSDNFLPATTLVYECYRNMFAGCTSLTTAPELPATTLGASCYQCMFYDCKNLTTAPKLPATALEGSCYDNMFAGCTSLTTAPELPATILGWMCYSSMFYGCTSLTTAPELPATTLEDYCYSSMFYGCTSLTTAPELPATTLTLECYNNMFRGCTRLNHIKMLATDISASKCLNGWVYNVASTGTFVKNPAMTTLPTGSSGIPNGWTVIDAGSQFSFNMQSNAGNIIGTYLATEGKTWADVIGVDPNFNEFRIDSSYNIVTYDSRIINYQNGNTVSPTDLILPHTYEVLQIGAGGGSGV